MNAGADSALGAGDGGGRPSPGALAWGRLCRGLRGGAQVSLHAPGRREDRERGLGLRPRRLRAAAEWAFHSLRLRRQSGGGGSSLRGGRSQSLPRGGAVWPSQSSSESPRRSAALGRPRSGRCGGRRQSPTPAPARQHRRASSRERYARWVRPMRRVVSRCGSRTPSGRWPPTIAPGHDRRQRDRAEGRSHPDRPGDAGPPRGHRTARG